LRYYHVTQPFLNFDSPEALNHFVQSTWESTWGVYGWFDKRLPDDFYHQAGVVTQVLLGLSALALILGLLRGALRRQGPPAYAWQGALILAAISLALVFSDVQFSRTVAFQPQGRYLFQLLLPAGMLFTGGAYALPPGRLLKITALSVPLLWLAFLNLVGLLYAR